MKDVKKKLDTYLRKRDGSVSRSGKAMDALSKSTGYSVEALRSFAYGRRSPSQGERLQKLWEKIRRG